MLGEPKGIEMDRDNFTYEEGQELGEGQIVLSDIIDY